VIHATRIDDGKRGGFVNNWQMGPGPENQASYGAKDLPRRRATDERRVILSSAYPAIDRRDPLVAALFGAPVAERRAQQQSAPCCTRCHMEQGTGHQAGCIVAMVAA
jgi:cytochrome c553